MFHESNNGDLLCVLNFTWSCFCTKTLYGDQVVVVGNIDELGNWRVNKGLWLSGNSYPIWKNSLIVKSIPTDDFLLEYKLIISRQGSFVDLEWEPIVGNHLFRLNFRNQKHMSISFEINWGFQLDDIVLVKSGVRSECFGYRPSSHKLLQNRLVQVKEPSNLNRLSFNKLSFVTNRNSGLLYGSDSSIENLDSIVDSATGNLTNLPPIIRTIQKKKLDPELLFSDVYSNIFINRNVLLTECNAQLEERYQLISTIGRGTWGEVYLVKDKTTMAKRAVKRIPKYFVDDVDHFRLEIEIMRRLNHRNVIKFYESFETDHDVYLVMSYCSGGELFDKLADRSIFTEELTMYIMYQIISSVAYCHSLFIVHRDLKPENFLFSYSSPWSCVKLIDFGLAEIVEPNKMLTAKTGSPYYVAPEVLKGCYDKSCDVWSIGIIMYLMLTGSLPFTANTDSAILLKISQNEVNFDEPELKLISEDALNLLKGLLTKDFTKRITLNDALKSPWFSNFNSIYVSKLQNLESHHTLISKLRYFNQLSNFKKLSLTLIVQNINDEPINLLHETFLERDRTCSGFLPIDEFRECLNVRGLNEVCKSLHLSLISDSIFRDGYVNYNSFMAICLSMKHYSDIEVCRKVFNLLDLDHNGVISSYELNKIFRTSVCSHHSCLHKQYNLVLSDKEVSKTIIEADYDADGVLSFSDFYKLLTSIPVLLFSRSRSHLSLANTLLTKQPFTSTTTDSLPISRVCSFI